MFSKKATPMDYFMGGIYRVKPHAIQKYKKEGYAKYSGLDLNKDIVEKVLIINMQSSTMFRGCGMSTWKSTANKLGTSR